MSRLKNWYLLQQLSWRALVTEPAAMATALKESALDHEGARHVDDDDLMRQAFQDKLDGRSNDQSAAMRELKRRHGI